MPQFPLAFLLIPLLLTQTSRLHAQAANTADPAPTKDVSGILTTNDGKPAAHFVVDLVSVSATSNIRVRVESDDDGKFSATGLRYGRYVIAPYLEEEGSRYRGSASTFYEPDPPSVQVNESGPSIPIAVRLRPPNRFLSGSITSADGSPVLSTVEVQVAGDPNRYIRFGSTRGGTFRVLVPPKTPLVIKVTADGYTAATQTLGPVDESTDPEIAITLQKR